MMTHLFENNSGNRIIAAKGAPEALMDVANLTAMEKQQVEDAINALTTDGYRVLGVGESNFTGTDFPEKQQEFQFNLKVLLPFMIRRRKTSKRYCNIFMRPELR